MSHGTTKVERHRGLIVLRRLNQIALSPYSTDFVIGGMALAAVLASILLTPSPDSVALFGFTIPESCTFKRVTGMGCFGCGLTRSFAYMGEVSIVTAFRMNMLGPVLYGLVLSQVPYRFYRCIARRGQGVSLLNNQRVG